MIRLQATPSGLLIDRRRKVGRKREAGRTVHPTVHRTGPTTRDGPFQNVNSAEVEKASFRGGETEGKKRFKRQMRNQCPTDDKGSDEW